MHPRRRILVLLFVPLALAFSAAARADGLDTDYFLRFGTWGHSSGYIWSMLATIIVVDYIWNFVVIGLPAIVWAAKPRATVARGLVVLTILGQIADRIGSVLALFVAALIAELIKVFVPSISTGLDSPAFGYSVTFSNLFCSGLAIGALALWFLRKRWAVPKALSWKIALAAAILTNPAWVLFMHLGSWL